MQSLHYLTLSILIQPLLSLFAEPNSLLYEGGAASIGMVMDWRKMAGRPAMHGMQGENGWSSYAGAWSRGRQCRMAKNIIGGAGQVLCEGG